MQRFESLSNLLLNFVIYLRDTTLDVISKICPGDRDHQAPPYPGEIAFPGSRIGVIGFGSIFYK